MRFITEFKFDKGENPTQLTIEYRKEVRVQELGAIIEQSFAWENPVNDNPLHHRLEIEAFPMDKWIEFKKRFADALPDYDVVSRTKLINAIAELESFGKPAGPKKEQL